MYFLGIFGYEILQELKDVDIYRLLDYIDIGNFAYVTGSLIMGNKNYPVINADDLDLFVRIAKHGFVDMDYIYRFAYRGRKKRTKDERLLQLERYKYLLINRTFIPPDYTVNYRIGYKIIALGKAAIELLADYDMQAADHAAGIKISSPYRMYHQVQVSTICDILQQKYNESDRSNWEVVQILNEKEAYIDDTGNQPDAALIFKSKQSQGNAIMVFLEIERSYASNASLIRKLNGYALSISKKLYTGRISYNLVEQRVLFVTQTKLQQEALLCKLKKLDAHGLHLYVSSFQEVAKTPLDQVYTVPYVLEPKFRLLSKYPDLSLENV